MKKIVFIATIMLVFTGCESFEKNYNENYNGGAISLGNNVYVKKMYIQGVYALINCDKDGNILKNQNMNIAYTSLKTQVSASVVSGTETDNIIGSGTYNFKCSEINDCYNQVIVVKNSLGK